jgi:hypothetical protein
VLLEIGDRGGIQPMTCSRSDISTAPHISLKSTDQKFHLAENAEGAIVFPLDKLDAFFATAFVQQIDLLGKMLDVGLGQLGIHSIRLEANDFNRLSRSLKTNIKFSKEIRLPKN